MAKTSFWRTLFPGKLRSFRRLILLAWTAGAVVGVIVQGLERDLPGAVGLAVSFTAVSTAVIYDAWRAYHGPVEETPRRCNID